MQHMRKRQVIYCKIYDLESASQKYALQTHIFHSMISQELQSPNEY